MRRLMMLLFLTVVSVGIRVQSSNIKFLQTIPESGSEISTFDIQLKFDISEAISESGNENIAIGFLGSTRNNQNARLFDGDQETGTLITTVLTKSVKGVDYSTDCIKLDIPTSFVPELGHKYTIVFGNSVAMYYQGQKIDNSTINYQADPLIFTFFGTKASSGELLFQKASISNNDNLDVVKSVQFDFNEDISIVQDRAVQIFNGEEMIGVSKSIEVDSNNPKTLHAIFDEETLYLGNQYTIILPEGIVSLKDDITVVNKPIEIKLNGTSTKRLSTKSVSPELNSHILPNMAVIKFNLEEGQTLTPPSETSQIQRGIEFYKGEISEDNFISNLLGTASGDGLIWDLSTFQFEPETKYILRKKADDITVWVNGKRQPAYGNEEVIISFTTPSVAEAGYPEMEFGALQYLASSGAEYVDYSENATVSKLLEIKIPLKDKYYYLNSKKYILCINTNLNSNECKIYEVTPTGDKYLSSSRVDILSASDAVSDFKVGYSNIKATFYEGKLYKIVIPENCFSAYPSGTASNMNPMMNFIGNREMTYLFTGSTPTKSVLLGCNVANNSVRASLHNIVWTFESEYSFKNDNNTISYSYVTKEGLKSPAMSVPVVLTNFNGKSALSVDFVSKSTGEPMKLINGNTYTFVVPKDLLVNVLNDEITNDEIVLTVKGGEDTSVPQKISVNLTVNGLHTASHSAIKGERYSLAMTPEENWKVESVMHGNKKLNNVNGTFITEPLNEDANITAHLEYNGQWATNDKLTDVWTIEANNVRIFRDSNMIVVEGVTPANTINVYSVAGVLINTTRVSEGNDTVTITVAPNQVYIVTVDGVAAKIQM